MSVGKHSAAPSRAEVEHTVANPEPLLTPKEAAARLAISERQLRDLTDDGAIGFVNIGLGAKRATRRYEPAEIHRFIEARRTVKVPAVHYRPSRVSSARPAAKGASSLEELRELLNQKTRTGKAKK